MEQTNSISQRLENEVNEAKQQQNKEHSSDVLLKKKRIRANKRERKEMKKQQSIKEGKINQKQLEPPKPQEIQHEPVLREMIALPNMKDETNGMTIMTYNLLAQSLCKRELFPNCGDALKWKNRKPRLIKEIFHYLPDIGCFQEMDEINYNDTFKPNFDNFGYDTLFFKSDTKRHGCCIAWKKSKVTKLKELTLDFDKIGVPTMTTNCIGIIVALGIVDGKENKGVVIGTTHLYWRPQSMYERTRQCLILYQNLLKIKEEFNFSAFLAGDFNSTPTDPIYHLMVYKSSLSEDQISILENSMRAFGDYKGSGGDDSVSEKKEETQLTFSSPISPSTTPKDRDEITIEQFSSQSQNSQNSPPLSLSTLLSNFENLPKCLSLYGKNYYLIDSENIKYSEPKLTNYGLYFKGTLDYIFFVLDQRKEEKESKLENDSIEGNNNTVKVTKLLRLPREEEFGLTSLPNYKFNSDHVCLMIEVVGLDN